MISYKSRFLGIVVGAFPGLISLSCQSEKAQNFTRPNFVFILVDDLGWMDLGSYGSAFYETPNIDQLAAGGMRFTNAYAACPVCSPTRASIFTGKYPARLDITDWIPGRQFHMGPQPQDRLLPPDFQHQLPLEELTLPEALKKGGYRTFFAGKWHLGEDSVFWPEHQGFDINKGGWSVGSPRGGYFSPFKNPRLSDGPEGEHLTDRLTEESIKFLESSYDQPFFLFLSFYAVHTPLQGKPELVKKYQLKADSLGLTAMTNFAGEKEWMKTASSGNYEERIVQAHPVYSSMIESLDWNVGRLLDKLEDLGISQNTVVIFMSDNGGLATSEGSPTSNLPLRGGKGWLYEGGIREPMIIRWPQVVTEGSLSDAPVTSTDFYPTILEMAGLPLVPVQHMDGQSLVPVLQSDSGIRHRTIFWHYPHYSNQGGEPGAAVRSGDFKLIEFYETGTLELYDLDSDLGEKHDLAVEMPEKVQELSKLLHDWQEEVGAKMASPNPAFVD